MPMPELEPAGLGTLTHGAAANFDAPS
jgi:hypothetical protein